MNKTEEKKRFEENRIEPNYRKRSIIEKGSNELKKIG